jgi:hypothetical protein
MEFQKECDLIRWFALHFVHELFEINPRWSLLNTQRHDWVLDIHGGAPTRPDWVGLHISMACVKKSSDDKNEEALFGTPAHWDLRDSL